jgi:hypothetical protein
MKKIISKLLIYIKVYAKTMKIILNTTMHTQKKTKANMQTKTEKKTNSDMHMRNNIEHEDEAKYKDDK